jgi:hypothetical protein
MRKEDFFLLIQKYLDGKATKEETELLHEWYDSFDDEAVSVPGAEENNRLNEKMLARFRESVSSENTVAGQSKTFVLKRKFGWMGIAAILLFLLGGAYLFLQKDSKVNGQAGIQLPYEKEEENDKYDGADQALAFEIERTKDPATGKVPWAKLRYAIEQAELSRQSYRTDAIQALAWEERGPNGDFTGGGNPRPAGQQTSGRIRAVMIDSLDPTKRTVFAGSVAGGLFKTTDITASPANWTLINDFMANLAIADICQDPRPGFQNLMYLATGESYGNADAVRGVGVYKSVDGGTTWNFLASTATYLNGTRILCDFQGNVYLGTRGSGLLRSSDGGTSWTNITPSGLNNDICDLEISSTAVAARLHVTTGIFSASGYRYTDIPATVTSGAGWNSASTMFTTFSQRSEMGISGNTLYVAPCNGSYQVPTIWKSTDGGDVWTAIPSQPNAGGWASGQGWYNLSVAINPTDANQVIVGGLDNWKTSNGGTSWTQLSGWATSTAGFYVHADQHDVQWWDNGNKLLYGCDGGLHYSVTGGTNSTDKNKGLRIKQFYSVAIHPGHPNYFIAGAQDNGMHRLNHPGLDSSLETVGGDGCYAAIDQDQGQYQFGSYVYNVYRRSTNNGASWSTPVNNTSTGRFVNPWDYDNINNIIYACNNANTFLRWNDPQTGNSTNVVSVTGFAGGNVSAVHASPYTMHRVYFGTGIGGVFYIDNANTGTSLTATSITPSGASGYANCVVTGSSDQTLMACYSSYGVTNVWVSTNGGTSWTACDGNLPDMPVRWGLFHPDGDTKAYIATETGVWETDLLNGASTVWTANPTFPNVRTDMIKIRASDRTIAAGTHGRGIWSAIIPPAGGFTFDNPPATTAACPAPASMDVVLGTTAIGGFSNPITVSSSAPPAGTTVSFIPSNTVAPGSSVTVRLNGTNTLTPGTYTLTITGTATGAATQTRNISYTITSTGGPAITAQPSNQTICSGSNTSFSITSATATSFQWQFSTDGGGTWNNVPAAAPYSGTTTATLTITGATAGMNGYRYRAIASTFCGTTTSNAAILTVNAPPAITTQPPSAAVCSGANHTFSVATTGTSLTYQWEISTDGGGTWNNVPAAAPYSGTTTANLTITGVTAGLNNNRYRVVISGVCPTSPITSNAAILTVVTSLTITGQPADATICEGANTSFTVVAGGTPTYQWQVSTDGGATWSNVPAAAPYSGTTSATLTITGATAALNNNRYRANLTSSCGNATSNAAILTVNTLPAISSSPASVTTCTGTNHTFSVTATGTGIAYQWQVSTDGGITYNNVPAAAPYSGTTTANLTITNITIGLNNNRYRVVVTGTCSPAVNSSAATLTVLTAVAITSNPTSQTVCEGTNVSFTVAATGGGLNYQWQVSTDGGVTYNNVPAAAPYSGTTTATLTITNVPPAFNNYRYRAVVTNGACTPGTSTAAILTVNTFPIISAQPQSVTICEGGNASFNVTATTGVGVLTYQWQFSSDGGVTYNNIAGATTATFAQTAIPIAQNGYRFRVIVTAGCGSVTSSVATLTVNALPVIAFNPPNVLCFSDPATTLFATPAGGVFSGPGVTGAGVFTPSLAGLGIKTIQYTATNAGCIAVVSRSILVNECVERHLRLPDFQAVFIYPNPNNGHFSIRMNTDLYTRLGVRIFNSMGQLVKAQVIQGATYGAVLPISLPTSAPSGVYRLYLYNDEHGFDKRAASIIVYR